MSSETRYRPKPVEGDIPEDELDYVELFVDLADVLEESGDTERLTLLLSTCRNIWMTINAIFVDIKEVIGYRGLYDRFSEMIFFLSRGRTADALELRNEINRSLGQATEKNRVWAERNELMERFQEAVEGRGGISRSRLHHFLERQRQRRATDNAAHGQYLALDLDTMPAKAEELLAILQTSQGKLLAVSEVGFRIAPISTALAPLIDRSDQENGQNTIFTEDPEALGQSIRDAANEAWPDLRSALSTAAESMPAFAEASERVAAIEGEDLDVDQMQQEFSDILDAIKAAVGSEQETLASGFKANVATAPMPAPFQIDLSRVNSDGKAHGRRFEIVTTVGNADQERDFARIALLSCGLPESAYSHVNPNDYVYDEGAEARSEVVDAAKQAIQAAKDAECVLLAMPEVFLPRGHVQEIAKVADESGIAVISGVEYRQGHDHKKAINEMIVALPGVRGPQQPRKQRPSVYEVREQDFEGDDKLWFFKHTAVGNLGVIICSDYLELDIVSELAGVPERLDTIIVCSRNPAPDVFETLAKADAARLYASIAVVNARPDAGDGDARKPASGQGTLVAVPTHKGLLDPEGNDIELNCSWSQDHPPLLKLFDLPLAKIRARDRQRPEDGFLPPPFYTRKVGN